MTNAVMQLLLQRLDGKEGGLSKEANLAISTLIRRKVRERGIAPRVIPFELISPSDPRIQRDLDRDVIWFLGEKEVDTWAVVLTQEGTPSVISPSGKRFRVDFLKVATPKVSKDEMELLAYTYSFEKWLEENVVFDIEQAQDVRFFKLVIAANNAQQQRVTGTSFTFGALMELQKLLTQTKKAGDANIIVLNKTTFLEFIAAGAGAYFGDILSKEVVISGYKYTTIGDIQFIVTENNEVVPPGIVWAFAKPQYLGVAPVLSDIKFFIKKEGSTVEWFSWQYFGMAIANSNGVACWYNTNQGWGVEADGRLYYTVDGVKYYEPPYPMK